MRMKQIKELQYQEYQQYQYDRVHGHVWTPETLDLICESNNMNPEEVRIEPGEQCSNPYECWYYRYCHNGNSILGRR